MATTENKWNVDLPGKPTTLPETGISWPSFYGPPHSPPSMTLFATELTVQVLPQETRELYTDRRRKEMQYGSTFHNFAHMTLHFGKSHFI